MKKFNHGENYWIQKGLDLIKDEAKKEIEAVEKAGKTPIMTKGFIENLIEDIKSKVNTMTRIKG